MSEIATKFQRPRLKDVARVAGVHVSTVSRALNDKTSHLITEEVRARIRAVCDELGYVPNQTASSLRTSRTHTIGVVVPDITNFVFPPIIRGIEDALSAPGYIAITVNTDGSAEREARMIDILLARSVDGLIMANVLHNDSRISELARRSVELVTVNRRVEDPGVASVVNDEEGGIRAMLAHLVGLGHRRIAHIAGPQDASTGRLRLACFRASLGDFGLAASDCPIAYATAFSEAEGERAARQLLSHEASRPTAMLCANDLLAVGAIAQARRNGLECPRDISVTGFNDMPFVDRIDPPLTTIRVAQYDAGRRAAEILIERLGGKSEPRHDVLPVELVVRASSAPPPA